MLELYIQGYNRMITDYIQLLDKDVNKEEIENKLVKEGESIIPYILKDFANYKGKTQGILAMVLIRIGKPVLKYLDNYNGWMYNYLKQEIIGF